MNSRDWASILDEQVARLAQNTADLWKVHCFREGNTRTKITSMCQFAEYGVSKEYRPNPIVEMGFCADAGLGSSNIRKFNSMGERVFIINQSIKKLSE